MRISQVVGFNDHYRYWNEGTLISVWSLLPTGTVDFCSSLGWKPSCPNSLEPNANTSPLSVNKKPHALKQPYLEKKGCLPEWTENCIQFAVSPNGTKNCKLLVCIATKFQVLQTKCKSTTYKKKTPKGHYYFFYVRFKLMSLKSR